MTPKKKKSLDKKLKTQVTKYENDLEEYLDALDDARRCKYDEVKFAEIIFLITHGSNLANDGKICQVEAWMVGKRAKSTDFRLHSLPKAWLPCTDIMRF